MNVEPGMQTYQRVINQRLADLREEEVRQFIERPRSGPSLKHLRLLEEIREAMED